MSSPSLESIEATPAICDVPKESTNEDMDIPTKVEEPQAMEIEPEHPDAETSGSTAISPVKDSSSAPVGQTEAPVEAPIKAPPIEASVEAPVQATVEATVEAPAVEPTPIEVPVGKSATEPTRTAPAPPSPVVPILAVPTIAPVKKQNAPFHLLMLPASEQPKVQTLVDPIVLLMDRKLRRDYLSRRHRVFRRSELANISADSIEDATSELTATTSASAVKQFLLASSSSIGMETTLWSGVSPLERALVDCCELPPARGASLDADADSSAPEDAEEAPGGSLAKGLEVKFMGLAAKHCHTYNSRLLALSILERSLDQDKKEAVEEQEEAEDDVSDNDNDSNSGKSSTQSKASESDEEGQASDESEEESEEESESEEEDNDDEDDDDFDPNETSTKRRSSRVQKKKRWRPKKRTKTIPASSEDEEEKPKRMPVRQRRAASKKPKPVAKPEPEPESEPESASVDAASEDDVDKESVDDDNDEPKIDRMTAFFSAGGLKILRSWLMDAMTPVVATQKPKSNREAKRDAHIKNKKTGTTSVSKTHKSSPYGPTLLPLLILLSEIPFDKGLIMESKINKQIRRLSKQVDSLVDIFREQHPGKEGKDALEDFVDPAAGVGGCVVIHVQQVLNKLKETWEEHAKQITADPETHSKHAFVDPYEAIKIQLREKLGILKDLETSKTTEMPDWLSNCEVWQREREKKRRKMILAAKTAAAAAAANATATATPTPPANASTQQMALMEREAERAALQDKLKVAQAERKAHLQRLKDQISKRMGSTQATTASTTQEAVVPVKRKKNGKSVQWKDGLTTDKVRKRDILEEVFVLKEVEEDSPSPTNTSKDELPKEEPNEEPEEEPEASPTTRSSNDDIGLFEMFDCDEMLLL